MKQCACIRLAGIQIFGIACIVTLIVTFGLYKYKRETAPGPSLYEGLESDSPTPGGTVRDRQMHEGLSSDSQTLKGPIPRILVYITTHFGGLHIQLLRDCWPAAIAKSQLLQNSDFMFFSTGDHIQSKELIDSVFSKLVSSGRNVTVVEEINPGYHEGAVLAMTSGVEHGYFKTYDWVIRLNLDVIIRNDTWLLQTMTNNKRIGGIFVDCLDREVFSSAILHTDFYAFRPGLMPEDAFRNVGVVKNAERIVTRQFEYLAQTDSSADTEPRVAWLPNYGPLRSSCRVRGQNSPVVHYTSYHDDHCLTDVGIV